MQKVTLKYDYTGPVNAPCTYEMTFDMSEMSLNEFLEEVKRFAVLVGYPAESVENAFL